MLFPPAEASSGWLRPEEAAAATPLPGLAAAGASWKLPFAYETGAMPDAEQPVGRTKAAISHHEEVWNSVPFGGASFLGAAQVVPMRSGKEG